RRAAGTRSAATSRRTGSWGRSTRTSRSRSSSSTIRRRRGARWPRRGRWDSPAIRPTAPSRRPGTPSRGRARLRARTAPMSLGRHFLRRPLLAGPLLALAACFLVAGLVRTGALESLELQGYDLLVRTRGFLPPHPDLVFVDFDDRSLDALG